MRWLLLFAPLIIQLALLYALSSWVNTMALTMLGKRLYFLLMWPGVIVHELSHAVGCLLTNTHIRAVSLFSPHDERGGKMLLGYVRHDKPRGPFSALVISAAPFFGGTLALWGIVRLAVPGSVAAQGVRFAFGANVHVVDAISGAASAMYAFAIALVRNVDWRSWKSVAAIYALFSLSAHVAPSSHDMRYAITAAAGIAVIAAPVLYLGDRYAPQSATAVAAWLSQAVGMTTALLGYALSSVALAFVVLVSLRLISGAFRRSSQPR